MKTLMQRIPQNIRPFLSVDVNAFGFARLEARLCIGSTKNMKEAVKALLASAQVEGIDVDTLVDEALSSGRQYTYDANDYLVDLEVMYHEGCGKGIRVDSNFLLPME